MKIEKVNLHDKTDYLIHIRNLKRTLNHELGGSFLFVIFRF